MGDTLIPIAITLSVSNYYMPDVNLSWTDLQTQLGSDFNVDYYYVYKQLKTGSEAWYRIAQVAGDTETYADTAVTAGITYRYYVTAVVRRIGECAQSNIVEATPEYPGLTEIYVGDGGVGGFVGLYTLNEDEELVQPTAGNYFYNSGDFANTPANMQFIENGYLHMTSFNARAFWSTLNLTTWTKAKIWNFVAGPCPPASCYRTGTAAVTTDIQSSGGVYRVTRTLNAARDTVDSYTISTSYGGSFGTLSNNTLGKHVVNSSGVAYWCTAGGIYKATVFPAALNDGATVTAAIGGISGMTFSTPPIALFNDGEYVLVMQRDSSTVSRRGCWLHVVRASDGNTMSLDLNATANTLDTEHEPLFISVCGNYAYCARIDGDYQTTPTSSHTLVWIIDLTDPDNPSIASTISTVTNGQTYVRGVVVKGSRLYFMANRYYNPTPIYYSVSFFVYNIQDKTAPVLITQQTPPQPESWIMSDSWLISTEDEAIDGGDKGQVVV